VIEIYRSQFAVAQSLLDESMHHLPLRGVLSGRHKGRVFVDDALRPACAYVWTPWGYHYLMGIPKDRAFISEIQERLVVELLPQSVILGEQDILLTLIPEGWEKLITDILPNGAINKLYRNTFAFNGVKFYHLHERLSDYISDQKVLRIDQKLALHLAKDISVTWRTIGEFLNYGFGYCVVEGRKIVSACISAFVAQNMVEIGVRTEIGHRRKGYSTMAAIAFINECLERNFIPHWECFWDNEPSISLATKLGFEIKDEMPIYYWQPLSNDKS
jgi:RimJ/RimL family protein N-acetyltransferase